MDVESIRKWSWKLARQLMEEEEEKTLDRFLTDVRSTSLPHEFSNVVADNLITFRKSGLNPPEIPFDLQTFNTVSDFKRIKAVVTATLYNALVKGVKKE